MNEISERAGVAFVPFAAQVCAVMLTAFALSHVNRWFGPLVLIGLGFWSIRVWARYLSTDGSKIEALALAAFAAHVVLTIGLFAVSYFHLPLLSHLQVPGGFWNFTPDSDGYHFGALALMDRVASGGPLPSMTSRTAYEGLVAIIYTIFGTLPLTAALVNCWLTVATALLGVAIVRRWISDVRVEYAVLLMIACWPSSFIWSSQLLRDCLAWFLTFAALLATVRVLDSSKPAWALIRILSLVLLATSALSVTREYAGWLLTGAIIPTALFLLFRRAPLTPRLALNLAVVFAVLAAASSLGTIRLLSTFQANVRVAEASVTEWNVTGADPNTILTGWTNAVSGLDVVLSSIQTPLTLVPLLIEQKRREFLIGSNASIGADADLRSWSGILVYLPVGAANVLFGPFPWDSAAGESTGIFKSMAIVEGLMLVVLLPVLVGGCIRAVASSRASAVFVLCYGAATLVFLALTIPNLGGLVRLRPQSMLPLFTLALAFEGGAVYARLASFAITKMWHHPRTHSAP